MPSFSPLDLPLGGRGAEFVPQSLGNAEAAAEAARAAGDSSPKRPTDPEEIRRQAYEEGRAAAQSELPWREAEELRSAAEALQEAARALSAVRQSYLHAHRRALVDLSLAVAEKILGRAIAADPDALASVVERAIETLGETQATRVQLSSRDYEALGRGLAPQLERLSSEHQVAVEANPNLAPGDVRVLAGISVVDARLQVLLQRVRGALAEAIEIEEAAK